MLWYLLVKFTGCRWRTPQMYA